VVTQVPPLEFFAPLVWLDGRPLLDTIEPYRRRKFEAALYTFDADGRPRYSRVLDSKGKKNWKTTDLVLAALYRLLAWHSPQGNDCLIIANDEDQAADDLSLLKKLVAVNPILDREVKVLAKEIVRLDGRGNLKILPAGDAVGAHGKTFLFLGIDEIHGARDYALLEALSPDPTRPDVMVYITSYAPLRSAPGVPLHDMFEIGKAGTDPRMFFSWYAGDYTTSPELAGEDVTPEQRANPSMASWDQPDYLAQQKARLPTSRYRRLHLNLPGSPEGAAFSAEHIVAATVTGRRRLPYRPGIRYIGAVDMSGGSDDDSTFSISHRDHGTGRAVLDLCVRQSGKPPFHPRQAVRRFAEIAREYGLGSVTGDAYAGQTFRRDFEEHGVGYKVVTHPIPGAKGQASASDFYEALEPKLNAGEVELLDVPELTDQLMTLVWRGSKITHESSAHDDFANSAAIALILADPLRRPLVITPDLLAKSAQPLGSVPTSGTGPYAGALALARARNWRPNGGGGGYQPCVDGRTGQPIRRFW
jgi:phage terminase large subunit-like protein